MRTEIRFLFPTYFMSSTLDDSIVSKVARDIGLHYPVLNTLSIKKPRPKEAAVPTMRRLREPTVVCFPPRISASGHLHPPPPPGIPVPQAMVPQLPLPQLTLPQLALFTLALFTLALLTLALFTLALFMVPGVPVKIGHGVCKSEGLLQVGG